MHPFLQRTLDEIASLRFELAIWMFVGVVGALVMRWLGPALPAGGRRWARRALLVVGLGLGMQQAVQRASLVDDAFISFRYAHHLAEGHGLVFNLGERVEGYTNFLWTLMLGLLELVFGLAPDATGAVLSLLAFVLNLLVVGRIAWVLHRRRTEDAGGELVSPVVPLAVLLLAVQDTFTTFGTTGLETGFASLLVDAGLYVLLVARRSRDFALAGLVLILATLTRPDHAIFYAAGALVVVGISGPRMWSRRRLGVQGLWRAGLREHLAYAAPFLLYLAYLAWKLAYYGDILPNTYYAKSANLSYWPQGQAYASIFYLASHMIWVVPLAALGLLWPASHDDEPRQGPWFRCALFCGPALVVYNLYVVKVGGDFMHGRFYVVTLPLLLLAAERAGRLLLRAKRRVVATAGALGLGLLTATHGGLAFFDGHELVALVANERVFYPLEQWFPPVVGHGNHPTGQALGRLHDAGLEPTLATTGIGMIGYYSQMHLIDMMGLTDPVVAHQPLRRRGRPGHEKMATPAYLRQKNPHFVRGPWAVDERHHGLTAVDFGPGTTRGRWFVFHYDAELMDELQRLSPQAGFTHFPTYLDRYLRSGHHRPLKELRADLAFFQRYYFDHNDDQTRLRALLRAIDRRAVHEGSLPGRPQPP